MGGEGAEEEEGEEAPPCPSPAPKLHPRLGGHLRPPVIWASPANLDVPPPVWMFPR